MSSKDYIIVQDGEMVHFKYIKREKVNGEWRYYYDKGSIGRSIKKAVGIDARNAYKSANAEAITAKKSLSEASKTMHEEGEKARALRAEANRAYAELDATRESNKSAFETASPISDKDLQKLQDEYVRAYKSVELAKKSLAYVQKSANNMQPTSAGPLISNTTALQKDDINSPAIAAAQKRLAEAEQTAAKARAEYNNAFKASQEAKKKAQAEYDRAVSENNKARKKYEAYDRVADKQEAKGFEAVKVNSEAFKNWRTADVAAQEALKKYYKTPLGSLKFLSDKGKELLDKIF